MPIYEFRCHGCGSKVDKLNDRTPSQCACGDTLRRNYSVAVPSPRRQWVPHFNHSVGKYVESERAFDEALKRGSEEQSIRTGMDHNYTRIDAQDQAGYGATEEGLYDMAKSSHDLGVK